MALAEFNQKDLKNKKALVVGVAKSGIAAAMFLESKGCKVVITDRKSEKELEGAFEELSGSSVVIKAGEYPEYSQGDFDFVVVSPGVPLDIPPIKKAVDIGIPVLGELELAYRFASSQIIAITGTNGKTTTTTLIGEIFRHSGRRVCIGGNIGIPLISEVEKYGPEDVIVAEVSSFQLECIQDFKPRVGLILNITPDHLDRHGSMENYISAKARIFENQDNNDFTVLNYDDPEVFNLRHKTPGKVIFFSRRHILEEGAYVKDGVITVTLNGVTERVCHVRDIFIKGSHNLENALAATASAYVMGVPLNTIGKVLKEFRGVEHRMELVYEINGVKFVNDSKGTNPDASIKALDAYDEPIVLLAGGRNKGSDFSDFAAKVAEKVRILVITGECRSEIREAVEKTGFKEIRESQSFDEAVRIAAREAVPGDVVLLSPACASWDMFKNFEERGERFKEIVMTLRR